MRVTCHTARRRPETPLLAAWGVWLLGCSVVGSAFIEAQGATSPTIAAIAADRSETSDQKWQRLHALPLPLVEASDSSGFRLVTFVFRSDASTSAVTLRTPLLVIDPSSGVMQRLPGTDIWTKTLRLRTDASFSYAFLPGSQAGRGVMDMMMAPGVIDPESRDVLDDGAGGKMSVVRLSDSPSDALAIRLPMPKRGRITQASIDSKVLGVTRDIVVYTPPVGTDGAELPGSFPLLILSDGRSYQSELVPTPTILDNLIASGAMPPVVAVFISSPGDTRARELSCSETWDRFLIEELLPRMTTQFHATPDPSKRVVGGSSLGGLAAACVALRHPEAVGNVLSVSGSFHLGTTGDPESEWVARYIAAHPTVPVRFFLRVGVLETIVNSAMNWPAARPTLLVAHRHLRTVLQSKGYRLNYGEFYGGHELLSSRWALAEALPQLFGDRGSRTRSIFLSGVEPVSRLR